MNTQRFTDTHIHLYDEQFDNDIDALIQTAISEGVERFYMPNIDSASIDKMLELENKNPAVCIPMMGLHPCSVKNNWKDEMKVIERYLQERKFAAVGEMGIDLYWDKTFLEEQKIVFLRQVELANQYKLPVVIHTRESIDVAFELLNEFRKEEPCGIFHCFSGNVEQAKKIIDMGFFLGIGGVVTFKNGGLDKVLPEIKLNNIVLETDAPYLAPVPFRGKRNEPVYVLKVAQRISELMNCSMEDVSTITTKNASNIFSY